MDDEMMEQMPDSEPQEGEDGLGSKVMVFSTAEYPQLEGLEAGASIPKITHTGNKVKEAADGSVTVELGACEFEVENRADRSLRETTGAPLPGAERRNADYATEY